MQFRLGQAGSFRAHKQRKGTGRTRTLRCSTNAPILLPPAIHLPAMALKAPLAATTARALSARDRPVQLSRGELGIAVAAAARDRLQTL